MLIVDLSMLVRRCFARMDFLKNSTGVPTGMEFGTMRSLEMLHKKFPEQEIVLCYDSPKNFKREKDSTYKANRSSPGKEFYKRLNEFKEFLSCLYPSVEKDGYEADDLMHSIAVTIPGPHLLYTNDHDLLQTVSAERDIVQLKSFHSKLFVWDEDKIFIEYGVTPKMLPVYFAFVGDKVDNIIGVPRIPKKFLAELIMWAYEFRMTGHELLHEIGTADWSPKMKASIREFVNSDQWHKNYDLIKLKATSYQIKHVIPDDELVIARLKRWEIYSLQVSKRFNLTDDNAEF